jgi:hypothetical protein
MIVASLETILLVPKPRGLGEKFNILRCDKDGHLPNKEFITLLKSRKEPFSSNYITEGRSEYGVIRFLSTIISHYL